MEKYAAFISYRHRPLDQAVAVRLHRMLERFRVPKDLRRDGSKKLGRVFRDEDELPLSTDLGESIRAALQGSDFLIAVCTPEYPQSRWCMEELDSFIALHGRDRVLAVLAAGTPEESFPPQLLVTRDARGETKEVEPLAANIVSPSQRRSLKKLKTEKLRLIASMLNCAYDDLFQREKRYRQRQILAFSALALAVAGTFIGVLLRKNAQIQAQYEETRRNLLRVQLDESVSRTENARNDLLLGRRSDAVRTLLKALPEDPDRPYDPSAEGVLVDALRVYADQDICFSANISQNSEIRAWALSGDGSMVFTWDAYGLIRAFSASGGQLRWQHAALQAPSGFTDAPFCWCEEAGGILCISQDRAFLLSAADGQERWSLSPENFTPYMAFPGVSDDEIVLVSNQIQEDSERRFVLSRVDTRSGEILREERHALSDIRLSVNNRTVVPAGSFAAMTEYCYRNNAPSQWNLLIVDRDTLSVRRLPLAEADNALRLNVLLGAAPGGQLAAAVVEGNDNNLRISLRIIDPASGETRTEITENRTIATELGFDARMACSDEYVLIACESSLYVLSLTNPEHTVRTVAMPGRIIDLIKPANRKNPGVFALTMDNGKTSFLVCDEDSVILTGDFNVLAFDAGLPLKKARMDPETEILSAVPARRTGELLLIRAEGDEPEETGFSGHYGVRAVSPSGEKVFLTQFNTFALYSVPEDRVLCELPFDTEQIEYPGSLKSFCFTSDEEYILLDQWIVSLSDGKAVPVALPGKETACRPVSAWIPALGKAETAVLLKGSSEDEDRLDGIRFGDLLESVSFRLLLDGEAGERIPFPEGLSARNSSTARFIWRLGGNGLLLIGTTPPEDAPEVSPLLVYDTLERAWCPLSGKLSVSSRSKAAAANAERRFALMDGNTLSLLDTVSEDPVWKAETAFPAESVSDLFFSPDDRLLLVFYGGQQAALYRAADGQLLGDVSLPAVDAAWRLQPAGDRLWLYAPGSVYTDSLVLDAETAEVIARIPGVVFVNPQAGTLYRNNANYEGTVRYPLYSLEALREKALERTR